MTPLFRQSARLFSITLLGVMIFLIAADRIAPIILPPESLFFRPWEYMTGGHRFGLPRTGESISMTAHGDLSNMLGVKRFEVRRSVTFTLDERGFRNTDTTRHEQPDVVVVGNSFMAGAGNSDEWTFAMQLQEQLRDSVSAFAPANISDLLRDGVFDEFPPQVVIWGRAERNLTANDPGIQEISKDNSCFQDVTKNEVFIRRAKSIVKEAIKNISEYAKSSVLRRLGQRLYQNVRFAFTGGHSAGVVIGEENMLFFNKGVRLLSQNTEERGMDEVADAIAHVRECLHERGMEFVFLPIPDKPHVYHSRVPADLQTPDPLDVLNEKLMERGVRAVHLWPAYKNYPKEELLYWKDDTHWNPLGIRIAVEETIDTMQN